MFALCAATPFGWAVQLGTPQRLDTDSTAGMNSSSFPQIAGNSTRVLHVVWQDLRDDVWAIRHRRSTNNGVSWATPDDRLSDLEVDSGDSLHPDEPQNALSPSIATDGTAAVHVAWKAIVAGPSNMAESERVVVTRSANGGVSWGSEMPLGEWSRYVSSPSICADSNDNVYVVWVQDVGSRDAVYFAASNDAGANWGTPIDLNASASSNGSFPVVACDEEERVYVAWFDDRDTALLDVYFRRSTNAGGLFGSEVQLNSETPATPSVGLTFLQLLARHTTGDDDLVMATWVSGGICLASNWSLDAGQNFQIDEEPATSSCWTPSCTVGFDKPIFLDTDMVALADGTVWLVYGRVDDFLSTMEIRANSFDPSSGWDTTDVVIHDPDAVAITDHGWFPMPRVRAHATDDRVGIVWMESEVGYEQAFEILASHTTGSGWATPFAVNTPDSPGSGEPEARSAFPQVFVRPTATGDRLSFCWDDRLNWTVSDTSDPPPTLPAPTGAPDVYFNVYQL